MQTENKGNMKRHWKNEAEWGSGAEHGRAGKQESGGLAGWGPPADGRRTNELIWKYYFSFSRTVFQTQTKYKRYRVGLLHAKASNDAGSKSALNQAELRSAGTSYCSAGAKRNVAIYYTTQKTEPCRHRGWATLPWQPGRDTLT